MGQMEALQREWVTHALVVSCPPIIGKNAYQVRSNPPALEGTSYWSSCQGGNQRLKHHYDSMIADAVHHLEAPQPCLQTG